MGSSLLTKEELRVLPVFPLPRVVFFPGTMLPLHLFEPRYCEMIEDCVNKGPRALAVALLRPGWEGDYEGRPPIYEIAGAGRIVAHERREDGSHDIVLKGVCRVKLHELEAGTLSYRRACAEMIDEDAMPTSSAEVAALISCASRVTALIQQQHEDFRLALTPDMPAGRIADIVADQLVADPELRQRILETLGLKQRVRLVMETVADLLAALDAAPQI